jgi:hypothetical protein
MDDNSKYLLASVKGDLTYIQDNIFNKPKKGECECRPFGNDDVIFFLTKTPNIFHRKMMEWIFGFKFKKYGQHNNKH